MSEVAVRGAETDDVPGMWRVAGAAWYAAHAELVGVDAVRQFLGEHYDAESLGEEVADPAVVSVVGADDRVVGFAVAGPAGEEEYGRGRLYVTPERWGEGVGSGLLARVEDGVRERDGDRIGLGVMAGNERAVAFYEARGFERVDETYDERLNVRSLLYEKDL